MSSSLFDFHFLFLKIIALLVVPFLPAANIAFATGFTVAERVLYLPSLGFCLLVGFGVQKVQSWSRGHLKKNSTKIGLNCLLLTTLCCHGVRTYRRSQDWNNELSLYTSGLSVNPENVKLLNNVGRLHEKNGDFDLAIRYYRTSIEIEPDYVRGHLNLANTLASLNATDEAEAHYRQAVKIGEADLAIRAKVDPLYLTALLRLATLLSVDPSRLQEAEVVFNRLLKIRSFLDGSPGKLGSSILDSDPARDPISRARRARVRERSQPLFDAFSELNVSLK